jgi:hypothetical protein
MDSATLREIADILIELLNADCTTSTPTRHLLKYYHVWRVQVEYRFDAF